MIDREYERKLLQKRWAKTKNGDNCCLNCRHASWNGRKPRCDRHKNHRRK